MHTNDTQDPAIRVYRGTHSCTPMGEIHIGPRKRRWKLWECPVCKNRYTTSDPQPSAPLMCYGRPNRGTTWLRWAEENN